MNQPAMEDLIQHIIANESSKRVRADLIKEYARHIKKNLEMAGLHDLEVSSDIELRNTHDFSDYVVYGVTLATDEASLELVSVDVAKEKILPIFIPQTNKDSLLIHENKTSLGADLFFAYLDGVLKPVMTDEPVLLDGIYQCVHNITEDFPHHLLINGPELQCITDNKLRSKAFLQKSPFMVPRYSDPLLYLEAPATHKAIEEFIDLYTLNDFVVKASETDNGAFVKLFSKENVEDAALYAGKLLRLGLETFLEERITPLDLRDKKGNVLDWNIRAFTTLEECPQWADAIVRFAKKSGEPVNISTGAEVELIDPVLAKTGVSLDDIMQNTIDTTKIFFNHVTSKGERCTSLLAYDLICSEQGVYCIEVNDSWSGGFVERSKLKNGDTEPLLAILTRMKPFLEENKQARLAKREASSQLTFPISTGRVEKKQNEDPYLNLHLSTETDAFAKMLQKVGYHQRAVKEFKRLEPTHQFNPRLHTDLADSYSKLGKVQEAEKHYKRAQALNPELFYPYMELGFQYLYNCRNKEAMSELEQAVLRNPDSSQAHYFLGLSYFFTGHPAKAAKSFANCLAQTKMRSYPVVLPLGIVGGLSLLGKNMIKKADDMVTYAIALKYGN